MSVLGDECARIRAADGWSVDELATAAGVSADVVTRVEAGVMVDTAVVRSIAKALGVDADAFEALVPIRQRGVEEFVASAVEAAERLEKRIRCTSLRLSHLSPFAAE